MTRRVLVVGAGIAGLAAARDLIRAGADVTVVDPADRVGGKILTETVDGFLMERGPDSFVTYRPAAAQLCAELGLADELIEPLQPRKVSLLVDGEMIPLPDGMGLVLPTRLGPFVTTRLLTPWQKLRAGVDALLPRKLGAEDVSIGSFLRTRLGDGVADRIANPLLGGIHGVPVDELSLDAVVPQLRTYEREHRSLIRASLAQGRAARARAAAAGRPADVSPFRTLRNGLGSLLEALVAELGAGGCDLRLGIGVAEMQRTGRSTRVAFSDGTVGRFGAVVLAAPPSVVAPWVGSRERQAADLISSIPLGSSAVVNLGYRADAFTRPPEGHGFLITDPGSTVVGGCTYSSNKWPDRAPSGGFLLRAFLPERSASLFTEPDDRIIDVVHRQVAPLVGAIERPILGRVQRWTGVMPRYRVGHARRMDALDEAMTACPDWALAGAGYRGAGIGDCVASGQSAAAAVLASFGSGDRG